jgi:ferredoxin-NADP reductase
LIVDYSYRLRTGVLERTHSFYKTQKNEISRNYYLVEILNIELLNKNILKIKVEKPEGYNFTPGQIAGIRVVKAGSRGRMRYFSFTGLNEWDYLEFIIKTIPSKENLFNGLTNLLPGDFLILKRPEGNFDYVEPGIFFAGGVGVTPFISILRHLYKNKKLGGNKLIYSVRSVEEVLLREELSCLLNKNFYCNITRDGENGCSCMGRISYSHVQNLVDNFNQHFYICGPKEFNKNLVGILINLGVRPEVIHTS